MIAKLVPQKFVHHDMVALGLLVLICFAVDVLTRTATGNRIGDWLEQHPLGRIPDFPLIRGIIRQCAGEDERSFQPALVEIEEALVLAFIIEKHSDGQSTVFVSSSPTPMAGAIYILQPERVHPVDLPLGKQACRTYREHQAPGQWPPAMISFMIRRPFACNGPMPLPGRNHMPLSLSRQ